MDYKMLQTEEDVTDEILGCLDGALDWFEDERGVPTEDFIDRLCKTYLNSLWYDLDSYDNEAARKIMREARKLKREREM
jgi:hypothetical protein